MAQCGGAATSTPSARWPRRSPPRSRSRRTSPTGKPWNYAGAEETAARLERAGFADVSCWLEDRPTTPGEPRAFVSTVCLVRHLDPLPAELRDPFIDRVLARAGDPLVLEYVRLNMSAFRP